MKSFVQKMSTIQNHAVFLKVKHIMMVFMKKVRILFRGIRLRLQAILGKLTKRQRIGLYIGVSFFLVFIMMLIASHVITKTALNKNEAIQFEKRPVRLSASLSQDDPVNDDGQSYHKVITSSADDSKLKTEFDALKSVAYQQFDDLRTQLQAMQASLASLPSQQDLQQLQQTLVQPNPDLLGKINILQKSMQLIVNQMAKQSWVNPGLVEKYFRLAAIQGFSDGMRAIIDVDGNQTVLSINESCPACRGWRLKNFDFTNQSAVFSKQVSKQILYVKLQAN